MCLREERQQRRRRKTMVLTLATQRSVDEQPFLTKSFPWKQEDTVNPRINCRLQQDHYRYS